MVFFLQLANYENSICRKPACLPWIKTACCQILQSFSVPFRHSFQNLHFMLQHLLCLVLSTCKCITLPFFCRHSSSNICSNPRKFHRPHYSITYITVIPHIPVPPACSLEHLCHNPCWTCWVTLLHLILFAGYSFPMLTSYTLIIHHVSVIQLEIIKQPFWGRQAPLHEWRKRDIFQYPIPHAGASFKTTPAKFCNITVRCWPVILRFSRSIYDCDAAFIFVWFLLGFEKDN